MHETRNEVTYLLRARTPLLWVYSHEEQRVELELTLAATNPDLNMTSYTWDAATGARTAVTRDPYEVPPPEGHNGYADSTDPFFLLKAIANPNDRQLWILRDLPELFNGNPLLVRALKTTAQDIQNLDLDKVSAIAIITTNPVIPRELESMATYIEWPLPTKEEIEHLLTEFLETTQQQLNHTIAHDPIHNLVNAASGLGIDAITASIAKSKVKHNRLRADVLLQEKVEAIKKFPHLEYIDLHIPREDIGGLENAIAHLDKVRWKLDPEGGVAHGSKQPKGFAYCGLTGTGKSYLAKVAGSILGIPIIRLDMGAVKSKYVGESENNIRTALKIAEAVSPCILLIDEAEKALAGATGPSGDGGVSADAHAALLNWAQEHTTPVIVIFTCNNAHTIPIETFRMGRVDQVFFVNLPHQAERDVIIAIHARKATNGQSEDIDTMEIARQTNGFSGAELEQAVYNAYDQAGMDGFRKMTTQDVLDQIATITPAAISGAETTRAQLNWAIRGGVQPASTAPVMEINDRNASILAASPTAWVQDVIAEEEARHGPILMPTNTEEN